MTNLRNLSEREAKIAYALATATMPATDGFAGADERTIEALDRLLDEEVLYKGPIRGGLWLTELASIPRYGRRLSKLPAAKREKFLENWANDRFRPRRSVMRGLMAMMKSAHFEQPALSEAIDAHKILPVSNDETPRWAQQVTNGRAVDEDLDLECEVVVIGTGAGGAAAAYELARRGRAVLLLESGDYHRRSSFKGRSRDAFREMYVSRGMTIALGNLTIPVWAGRAVGGSTVVNSGTCYRAPAHTLNRWADEFGLVDFTPEALAPYYEQVEQMLDVTPAAAAHLGGPARVIARGAEALGLRHRPLPRNAPDCDGQGVCVFGCPTSAKRSTDVSYIPAALERGAQLITGAHVERVDTVAGRARGVRARLASGKRLRVRADVVVVAGGALLTPLLLQRSGICTHSGWLGRNLSIHPAGRVQALFDEDIDMTRGIPQSYSVETYAEEGLLFEGGSLPLDGTAITLHTVGKPFMEVMAEYRKLASFGFMIQDASRGTVRAGAAGGRTFPIITYNMNKQDAALMQKGYRVLSEIYFAAGARRVLPSLAVCSELESKADIDRLRNIRLKPTDMEVAAFHPLGTCRAGTDPARSCVGPDLQAHDTENVYVTDGSALPSSLGANPQLTIMAAALRSAGIIDSRLG